MEKLIRLILLLSVLVAGTLLASDPAYYVKKKTWNETERASREALMKLHGSHLLYQARILGQWSAIGPFKSLESNVFGEAFAPEWEIDLTKSYDNGRLRWLEHAEWRDGVVNDLGKEIHCATYLFRIITVPNDTVLPASLGSDDGIKVWVNNKQILGHDADRGCRPDQEHVDLVLRKGANRLLLKINNNDGGFAFYFRLENEGVNAIWKLLKRDFADKKSVREMAWEEEDSIWTGEWKPGNLSELARRYVHASMFDTPKELARAEVSAEAVKSSAGLKLVRDLYLRTRIANTSAVILTPKPSPKPRINGAMVFGARPGNPFLFTIAATGKRPIRFSAEGLPEGLSLDGTSGQITGVAAQRGTYEVDLKASNVFGSAKRQLKIVIGDQIALTPPLGWNSWNCFAEAVNDDKVRSAADAMVKSGLVNHGWTYINIDDCWEIKPKSDDPALVGSQRNAEGMINTNKKFPDMKALSDYIHSKGLKMGIYSSPGPLTCAGFTASYQYEENDAHQCAAWGIDYLKYDWCSYGLIAKDHSLPELKKPYLVMRAALNDVKRDIVFSLCQYGMGDVWQWGGEVGGNSWRTTDDITDSWKSMSEIGFSQAGHEVFAKPGNWNDPDMLVVGKVGWGPQLHQTRLSPNEQYTHISLWCLLCSPLLIGCDMTQMDDFTLNLLTNDEVLDVSQDPLGKQASRVSKDGDLEVWAKDMEDGSKAVGLFNRGIWKSEIKVRWSDLGLEGRQTVRDLWRQKNLGAFKEEFKIAVPRHGVVLVKISSAKR
jgi:alpha-galactosidase